MIQLELIPKKKEKDDIEPTLRLDLASALTVRSSLFPISPSVSGSWPLSLSSPEFIEVYMTRVSSVERKCSAFPFCDCCLITGLSRLSVDPAVWETEEWETDDFEENESVEVGGERGGKGINVGSTFATTMLLLLLSNLEGLSFWGLLSDWSDDWNVDAAGFRIAGGRNCEKRYGLAAGAAVVMG